MEYKERNVKLPMPIFACKLARENVPLFLTNGGGRLLALFTSRENAELFIARAKLPFEVVPLASVEKVRQYVADPSGDGRDWGEFNLAMDAIAPGITEVFVMDRKGFYDTAEPA